jgi:hypothetical protein
MMSEMLCLYYAFCTPEADLLAFLIYSSRLYRRYRRLISTCRSDIAALDG